MNTKVKTAVEQILALRAIANETGTKTTRAQNAIFQSLPDEIIVQVCVEIKRSSRRLRPCTENRVTRMSNDKPFNVSDWDSYSNPDGGFVLFRTVDPKVQSDEKGVKDSRNAEEKAATMAEWQALTPEQRNAVFADLNGQVQERKAPRAKTPGPGKPSKYARLAASRAVLKNGARLDFVSRLRNIQL